MHRWWIAIICVLALALAAVGCGSDECGQAADKAQQCGLPATVGSCDTAVDKCEADCINAHSCDEIRQALLGTPNAYSACDDACH